MSILGILFLTISFSSLITNNFFHEIILHEKNFNTIAVMIIGIFLTIYGGFKIKLNLKSNLY
jgi:formate-dependent nitrite reductase membrane component NrfD